MFRPNFLLLLLTRGRLELLPIIPHPLGDVSINAQKCGSSKKPVQNPTAAGFKVMGADDAHPHGTQGGL